MPKTMSEKPALNNDVNPCGSERVNTYGQENKANHKIKNKVKQHDPKTNVQQQAQKTRPEDKVKKQGNKNIVKTKCFENFVEQKRTRSTRMSKPRVKNKV